MKYTVAFTARIDFVMEVDTDDPVKARDRAVNRAKRKMAGKGLRAKIDGGHVSWKAPAPRGESHMYFDDIR